jgi:hypothetical protein
MMSKRILNIAVLSLCSILTSCGVFYIDLGNRYAWIENREIVKITEEKENALCYDVIIRPQVLNYDYDDQYIIVYQVYDGSSYYDVSTEQDKEKKDSLYTLYKKIKNIKHCYWIINKETDQVIGPMRKADFDRKCQELNVKAKMNSFHEEKFWEINRLGPDSAEVMKNGAIIDLMAD